MRFRYKAKKGLDEFSEGVIEAGSQEEVLNKLVTEGLFPISVEEEAFPAAPDDAQAQKRKKPVSRSSRINSRQVFIFTQKLNTLIRAYVALLPALKIIHDQTDNLSFQAVILDIFNATKEGRPFSESLGRYPRIFPSLYINIIKSGEASGALDSALEQIMEFLSRKEALKTKVMVALAYPSLLLGVGVLSIFILLNFVIPRLMPILVSSRVELPLITKIILKISMISHKSWIGVLAVICVFALIGYQQRENYFYKKWLHTVKMKLPIIKRIILNRELVHFSHSLSLLLKGGIPALRALETVIPGLEDFRLREDLKEVLNRVASGQSLSKSMEALTSLPDFFTKMIAVGEESGRLTEVLEEVADSYTQQLDADVALISSLLEPLMILVLGVILGGIVMAILIPTFQMTQLVQ